nr:hypothetical protein CFP56_54854 [Quercus suber]
MSDPAAQPGAPTNGATKLPPSSDKSVAREAQRRAPKATSLAATPDRILLRLNKLLASPGGLSSFLSTFNYALYFLTYAESKTLPLQARLRAILAGASSSGTPAIAAPPGPSHIAALGSLLSQTRTTLRLFGLLPLYAWLRQLLQGPKPGQDSVLYTTALTQCTLYIAFQFLENVAVLTDHGVLPKSYTSRWTAGSGGKTTKILLWSYRTWLGAVACDVVRLMREAQLEREKRRIRTFSEKSDVAVLEQDAKTDAQWWAQIVVPMGWLPIAYQFSTEKGIPGFNLGLMGALGGIAGLGRTADLWAATA